VGGGGKLYRDILEKVSPTTAGNIIDDLSKTSSLPERQITVNADNDPLCHLTATILHFSLKNDNLPSTSTKIRQRSLLQPDSLFTAGTADLQKQQRPFTVFTVTI